MGTPDATEGVMAWVDKREPHWTGRLDDDWPGVLSP
jgi:hypothetical protein